MLENITYMLMCLALALTRAGLGHNAHAIGLICSLARFNTSYGAKLSLNTVKPLSGQSSAPVNGSRVNGSLVNGSRVNGSRVNGSLVNGSLVNGSLVNGSLVNVHAIGLICSLARFNTSYGAKLSLNTVKPLSGQSSALSGSLKAQTIMIIIIIHSFVTLCKCLLTSAYQKCYSHTRTRAHAHTRTRAHAHTRTRAHAHTRTRAHARALFDSRFPLFVLRFPPYLIHDSLYLFYDSLYLFYDSLPI